MHRSDIGLIGLAVMGENLVMNMESSSSGVGVQPSTDKVKAFCGRQGKGKNIIGPTA